VRLFLAIAFGALIGAVAVLVYLTVDTDFDPDDPDDGGVGNVRVEFDHDALEVLVLREIGKLEGVPADPAVNVLVRDDGYVDVELGLGTGGLGVAGTIVVNPEVADGRLALEVVEARFGEFSAPDTFVPLLEDALVRSMEGAAEGLEYRLVAIITRDGVLAFEIAI